MTHIIKACGSCEFWDLNTVEQGPTGDRSAQCRRYPAPLTHTQIGSVLSAVPEARIWPQTFSDDWCGEHLYRWSEDMMTTPTAVVICGRRFPAIGRGKYPYCCDFADQHPNAMVYMQDGAWLAEGDPAFESRDRALDEFGEPQGQTQWTNYWSKSDMSPMGPRQRNTCPAGRSTTQTSFCAVSPAGATYNKSSSTSHVRCAFRKT